MERTILTVITASVVLSASTAAIAQSQTAPQIAVQAAPQASVQTSAQFARFVPSKTPVQHRIDYSLWDDAMKNLVVSMGPSLRKSAGSEVRNFGSRRRYGSNSRYRLEGTRVMFSFLDQEVISSFTEYRKDLEATANQLNISTLPRNEQLAFWTNLHNVAMVEQIGIAWPTRQPRDIKIGGVPLEEARFITINGVAMSPKDIRTQIVYPNWSDPRVVYGFWRGDIGGPSLQRRAFNGENLKDTLERSAREFVNSLRGTQKNGSTLAVSDIYTEAAPYYFTDFDRDLRTHLAGYANVEVQQILASTSKVDASISEPDIADLAGGVREPSYSNITTDGNAQRFRIPQSMAQLLAQRERKFDIIEREGVRTGTVTFSPIELPGEDPKADEVE